MRAMTETGRAAVRVLLALAILPAQPQPMRPDSSERCPLSPEGKWKSEIPPGPCR